VAGTVSASQPCGPSYDSGRILCSAQWRRQDLDIEGALMEWGAGRGDQKGRGLRRVFFGAF